MDLAGPGDSEKPLAHKLGLKSGKNIVALGGAGDYGRER